MRNRKCALDCGETVQDENCLWKEGEKPRGIFGGSSMARRVHYRFGVKERPFMAASRVSILFTGFSPCLKRTNHSARRSQAECVDITDTTMTNTYHFTEMSSGRTFFITTVTWQRTPLFRHAQTAKLMMDVLEHYRVQKKYLLHEFVVMPDHLHLLVTPAAGNLHEPSHP
jgi:hypothetical protein